MNNNIIIKGLKQNNLKNISLELEKNKIIVFTGVSGSGKSSIVFDTIAAESQRQMNETYSAWARSRLPKYQRPKVEVIDHLNASVIIDQSRIVGNARSTVGTISEMYSTLRVLFSRVGQPQIGPASYFSFNNPNGMCKCCSGIGKIMDLKIEKCIDAEQSWNESMIKLPGYKKDNYYWRIYTESNLFDLDKKYKDYSLEEKNLLLYGSRSKDGIRENKKVEGIKKQFERLCLMKSEEQQRDTTIKKIAQYMEEETCPACHGKRLQPKALEVKVLGYTIDQMCEMELSQLKTVLQQLDDPTAKAIAQPLIESLTNMIDIGLPYLSLNRETTTLSGGEAQRLKIVRYMSSSLTGMTYIFDEPSVGLHPRDVYRMCKLLQSLRDKGNTVLVVEHDKDIIKIADEIVDVGPKAGVNGGKILFQGSYADLLLKDTLTSQMLKQKIEVNANPAMPKQFLPIRDAHIHNLKNVNVDIPLNVLCVVTGVAGSGKSSLIRDVFAKKYQDKVVMIDQSAITATGRSTVCTYLGFFDEIRKVFAQANQTDAAYFSFNSKGACPHCKGRGTITTELVFMDPVTTECEHCGGKRYSQEALRYCYQQKNIVEVLQMNVLEAIDFFHDQPKILKALQALKTTGVEYLSLGQPLSTFSGGERQRVKLAKELHKKGNIYILDEPTTGLHGSDIEKIVKLLKEFVKKGNTVVVIEHNVDIMKMADYIIDVGPDGGSAGGQIVFTGTVKQMVESSDSITAQYIRKSLVE